MEKSAPSANNDAPSSGKSPGQTSPARQAPPSAGWKSPGNSSPARQETPLPAGASPGGKFPGRASPGQEPPPTGAAFPGIRAAQALPAVPPGTSPPRPFARGLPPRTFSYLRTNIGADRLRPFPSKQKDGDLYARGRARRSAPKKTVAGSAPYDADDATTKARRSESRHSRENYDDRRRRTARRADNSSSSWSSRDSRRRGSSHDSSDDERPRRKRSHKSRERKRRPRRTRRTSSCSSSSSFDGRRGGRSPSKGRNGPNESTNKTSRPLSLTSSSREQMDETPVDPWQPGTGMVWSALRRNETRWVDAAGTGFSRSNDRGNMQPTTLDSKVNSQRTRVGGSVFRYETRPTTYKGQD